MRLSVLIQTSPGREQHLRACLQALSQQQHRDFEVLVLDDGSTGCAAVVSAFSQILPIRHLWRPNDFSLTRSNNLGAAQAGSEFLVFISCDLLLNPLALTAYAAAFAQLPDTAVFGYFGSDKTDIRQSVLVPGREVNLRDERFAFVAGRPVCQPQMREFPQHFAWGGNWGIRKGLYQALGGMDESYTGWGHEDVEFANRILYRRGQLAFSLDVWGEHQAHPDSHDPISSARNRARIGTYWIAVHEPALIYDPASNRLREHLERSP